MEMTKVLEFSYLFVEGPHTRPHHTTADKSRGSGTGTDVEISLAFGEARPGELLEAAAVARDCGQQQRRRRREGAHGGKLCVCM